MRNEYYKKIKVLNENLIGTKWEGILDINNSKLTIACEYGIGGSVRISYTRELNYEESVELESFLCDLSKENKLLLYCVDYYEEEIVLENPTIKKKIQKYFVDKLLRNYFGDRSNEKEVIPLVPIDIKSIPSISINKEILESQLKELNSKTNNTHYFIKNDVLRECNIKERIQLVLCGLEGIKDFKLIDDRLIINLKDGDGDAIHLTKEGSCI